MDPYGTYIIAASRQDDFAREAATERQARIARRARKRNIQAEPRPAPQQREIPRPVAA